MINLYRTIETSWGKKIEYMRGSIYYLTGIDVGDASYFEISNTSYGDLHGSLVEMSNQRVLMKILAERGIDYRIKTWGHHGQSLLIEIGALGAIEDIIDGLRGYPLIDEDDYMELEHEKTIEYIEGLHLGDIDTVMSVYYRVLDNWGEGVIFETGGSAYLDEDFIEDMRVELSKRSII